MCLSKREHGLCYCKTVNRYFVSSCQKPTSASEWARGLLSWHFGACPPPRCSCIQTQRKSEWVTTKQNMVIVARASAEGSTFGRKSGYNGAPFFPFRRENRKQLLPLSPRKPQGGCERNVKSSACFVWFVGYPLCPVEEKKRSQF